MSFDPQKFIDISKELQSGQTEAHYRSIINRAYYGAFGHIRNKLDIFVSEGQSAHQEVYKYLIRSTERAKQKAGKRLETLFKKRRDADYKHKIEIKAHNCQFCVSEAEEIIKLYDSE